MLNESASGVLEVFTCDSWEPVTTVEKCQAKEVLAGQPHLALDVRLTEAALRDLGLPNPQPIEYGFRYRGDEGRWRGTLLAVTEMHGFSFKVIEYQAD